MAISLTLSGCLCDWGLKSCQQCKSEDECGDIDIVIGNSEQEAIDRIRLFKNSIADEAGDDALRLRSLQSASPGAVLIKSSCNPESVHSINSNPKELFFDESDPLVQSEILPLPTQITREFDWSSEWNTNLGINIGADLRLLNAALKVAKENQEIRKLNIKLSLKDASLERITQSGPLLNRISSIFSDSVKLEGNSFVTGVVRGRVSLTYAAISNSGDSLDIDLSVGINSDEEVKADDRSADYAIGSSTDNKFMIVEENTGDPTVFAILYTPLRNEIQDLLEVQRLDDEFCMSDDNMVTKRRLLAVEQSQDTLVAAMDVELGAGGSWFLTNTNLVSQAISYNYAITVRNGYHQIVDVIRGSSSRIDPSTSEDLGQIINTPYANLPFDEARLSLSISDFRCWNFPDTCP